jgi:hypothetical protein
VPVAVIIDALVSNVPVLVVSCQNVSTGTVPQAGVYV